MLVAILAVAAVALLAFWYVARRREIRASEARAIGRSALREPSPEVEYWGVQVVVPEGNGCAQAMEIHGQRFPMKKAPVFPLTGCSNAACRCQAVRLPERRKYHRRCGEDRRGAVRFDPERPDRRAGEDRRKESNPWTYPV